MSWPSLPLLLESSRYSDWFRVDPASGEISTQTKLDCELEDTIKIILLASDGGKPNGLSSTATLAVKIQDVNDEKPKFQQDKYQFVIEENLPIRQTFGKVKATDNDLGENGR